MSGGSASLLMHVCKGLMFYNYLHTFFLRAIMLFRPVRRFHETFSVTFRQKKKRSVINQCHQALLMSRLGVDSF